MIIAFSDAMAKNFLSYSYSVRSVPRCGKNVSNPGIWKFFQLFSAVPSISWGGNWHDRMLFTFLHLTTQIIVALNSRGTFAIACQVCFCPSVKAPKMEVMSMFANVGKIKAPSLHM